MATDKMYTVAGVSTLNGDTKARFANDVMRIKVLAKNGHENIQLVELPESMTKVDAAKFIAALPEFADAASQEAIGEYLTKHDRAPKVEVKKAVKKAVASKPAKANAPKVTAPAVTEDEDAPF
jgi:hypothetical protein